MKKYLALLALAALFARPAFAGDAEDIARAETYLNARHNIAAKFIQTTDDGQSVTGTVLISRPGKMNLSYDPPLKDFIIADGSFIYMWDGELEQSTTVPLGGSLPDLILRDNLRLSGDVKVLNVARSQNKLEITVAQTSAQEDGTMTLVFEDKPFMLRGWRIQDPQQRTTSVALQGMREDMDIPARSFRFVAPKTAASRGEGRLGD